jgi:hypothetical protein
VSPLREQIKRLRSSSTDIPFGVVTNSHGFLGNVAEESWKHKWINQTVEEDNYETVNEEKTVKRDIETMVNGKLHIETVDVKTSVPVYEEIEIIKNGVSQGMRRLPKKVKMGTIKKTTRTLNPKFDSTLKYIPRSQRAEWNIIGVIGALKVLKTSVKAPNWVKIGDVDDQFEMLFIK